MTVLSHAATMDEILRRRETDPQHVPTCIATVPQLRMTRRIVGEYTLHDTEMHTPFADSVGMVSDWRKRGPVYEVPFGTLYNAAVKNLFCAGRCTSVTDDMWDIMRVIPCCAVTGQAAGIAAVLAAEDDLAQPAALLPELQKRLQKDGVVLHEAEL